MTRHVYKVDISAKRSLAWMPACAGMTLAAVKADGRGNLFTPQIGDDADYRSDKQSRYLASKGLNLRKGRWRLKEDNLLEEDFLEVLESAIESERASQDRYRSALDQARSPESRALFQDLIEYERQHEKLLEERYDQIKKKLEVKIIWKWSRWVKASTE